MSISQNIGGLSGSLGRITSTDKYIHMKTRVKKGISKVPVVGDSVVSGLHNAKENIKYAVIDGILFEELGFKYIGPVDGHDVKELCQTLQQAKKLRGPVLIHAVTQKGKGYRQAEKRPNVYHGIGAFDADTGKPLKKPSGRSYSEVFGQKLTQMAEDDDRITAITAAMKEGVGLECFCRTFPKRFFDVGIAEAHGVTFAAGLAKAGQRPYVAVYSSFLQRAYDQILEDVCLQKLPVTFCIDRAGIVGADGETHHGLFDLIYLRSMPNMTVFAPKDGPELEAALERSLTIDGPCAIRYPRGTAADLGIEGTVEPGKAQRLLDGADADIWAAGSMVSAALDAAELLRQEGIRAGVVNMACIRPFDEELLCASAEQVTLIVTVEDGIVTGGVGESVRAMAADLDTKVVNLGWPDRFIEHGGQEELYRKYGLDKDAIADAVRQNLG